MLVKFMMGVPIHVFGSLQTWLTAGGRVSDKASLRPGDQFCELQCLGKVILSKSTLSPTVFRSPLIEFVNHFAAELAMQAKALCVGCSDARRCS